MIQGHLLHLLYGTYFDICYTETYFIYRDILFYIGHVLTSVYVGTYFTSTIWDMFRHLLYRDIFYIGHVLTSVYVGTYFTIWDMFRHLFCSSMSYCDICRYLGYSRRATNSYKTNHAPVIFITLLNLLYAFVILIDIAPALAGVMTFTRA